MAKEYIVTDKLMREAIDAIIDLTIKRECLWTLTSNDNSYPKKEAIYKGTKFSLSISSSYISLHIFDKDKKQEPAEFWKSQGTGEHYDALKKMDYEIEKTMLNILEDAPNLVSKFLADYKESLQPPKKAETILTVESQEEFVLNDRQE